MGHTPVAPSAVPLNLPGAPTPRELTTAEIEDIIERFVTAATVCETAGFDGVQVHARARLPRHSVPLAADEPAYRRVGRRPGNDGCVSCSRSFAGSAPGVARLRVGVKLNSADFQRGGFSEDESRDVVAALAGEGLDLIEISGGNYESPAMSGSRCGQYTCPRGVLPGLRPDGAADWRATCRWRSPAGSAHAQAWTKRCTPATAT